MGKIKSAIITAILLAAILVLGFFATVSCAVPNSNGVKRYNSRSEEHTSELQSPS